MYKAFEEIMAHREAVEHYLDAPETMTRFREQLLAALRDPTYSTRTGQFDWTRFAREFSAPDFDPPLTSLDLFDALRRHFHQPGRYNLPRARVWWLVRLVYDVENPVEWLREQQRNRRGAFVEIARKLDCPSITNVHLSMYLSRLKTLYKPRIPDRFQAEGMRVLALVEDYYAFRVWGVECRRHGRRLVWGVVFREELEELPYGTQPPPYDRSPQAIAERLMEKNDFRPQVTLFYIRRLYERKTGRLWWGYWPSDDEQEKLGLERVEGPVIVKEWDEDGWPIIREADNNE